MPNTFHPFGAEHLAAIFLTITLPFALAALVWRTKSVVVERAIAYTLCALLIGDYFVYLYYLPRYGNVSFEAALPMQLCDWAMAVIIVTLVSGNRRWFEVAYFWGIGGTLQAVLTPNLFYGFPDLRFISFFVSHSGIIIGIVFLMLTRRLRPYPISIVRAFIWAEVYFVVALVVDHLTGVNYGFLLHKPEAFSLLSLLSDSRPLYLLEMHALALVFFGILYLPFAIYDFLNRATRKGMLV